MLPAALYQGASARLFAGDPATAAALGAEADAAAEATGTPAQSYTRLMLAAWAGRDAEVAEIVAADTPAMTARGHGRWLITAGWATAMLGNGLGRYDQALAAAEQASAYPDELGLATWSTWPLPELVEAAARSGQPGRGAAALRRLSAAAAASGTDWALGIQARSEALLSEGESAEYLYRQAIERLGRTGAAPDLARARLVYGEWLRRHGRRVDARQQLRAAHQMLTAMGADGFAERARRELVATGETVRKRTAAPADAEGQLTAQEAEIARLAGDGHTNPEISTQLFISPRTVEWHLRKVFTKLGISSRRQIRPALRDAGQLPLPA